MDCSSCCEGAMAISDESTKPEVELEVHPFGDLVMDRGNVDAEELDGGDVPAPPDMPEDLDGNWERPRRERVRALPKPITPTKEQRARHRLTHIPYADWCSHCVRCRGRNLPHRKLTPLPAENVVPVISMDLAHIKRNEADKKLPFIVARDHKTRITFAHLLKGKSTVVADYSDYVVNALYNDIRMLDYKKIILKNDQESALKALYERLRRLRNVAGEQTLEDNSPVGESQSNGVVEEAIKEIEEVLGTILSSLDESLNGVLPRTVRPWLGPSSTQQFF